MFESIKCKLKYFLLQLLLWMEFLGFHFKMFFLFIAFTFQLHLVENVKLKLFTCQSFKLRMMSRLSFSL